MFSSSNAPNKEAEDNIPLLDPSPSEDNLQFMENSYKLDSSASSTSINIPNTQSTKQENQTQPKMSIPVNLSLSSPVLRSVYQIQFISTVLIFQ